MTTFPLADGKFDLHIPYRNLLIFTSLIVFIFITNGQKITRSRSRSPIDNLNRNFCMKKAHRKTGDARLLRFNFAAFR